MSGKTPPIGLRLLTGKETVTIGSPELITQSGFQPPRYIDRIEDCYFYHSVDLPSIGVVEGRWDLRPDIDEYLGQIDYRGKYVVDVGTATGYVCFEMEKRGAHVTAFDRLIDDASDGRGLIPYHDFPKRFGVTFEQACQRRRDKQIALQNSFWLTHRLLQSKARLYCGTVYNCPEEIGAFQIAFFGCILLHLRDPLQALGTFAAKATETVVITDTYENIGSVSDLPVMWFRPNVANGDNPGTWWYLTPRLLQEYLAIVGFASSSVYLHTAQSVPDGHEAKFFTVVAHRPGQ